MLIQNLITIKIKKRADLKYLLKQK